MMDGWENKSTNHGLKSDSCSDLSCLVFTTEPHTLVEHTKACISGRVRDNESKKLVAKQMQEIGNGMPQFDLKTGVIKSKKAKKEVPPEAEILRELKTLNNKCHVLSSCWTSCVYEALPVSSAYFNHTKGQGNGTGCTKVPRWDREIWSSELLRAGGLI